MSMNKFGTEHRFWKKKHRKTKPQKMSSTKIHVPLYSEQDEIHFHSMLSGFEYKYICKTQRTEKMKLATGDKQCANCGTRQTSVWRKGKANSTLCNRCGLYERRHDQARPFDQRRQREEDLETKSFTRTKQEEIPIPLDFSFLNELEEYPISPKSNKQRIERMKLALENWNEIESKYIQKLNEHCYSPRKF